MIKLGTDFADLKENFNIFSEGVIELLGHFVKTDEHTTSLSQDLSEIRQQIPLMDERKAEMNVHVVKFEKELNESGPQAASLAVVVRTTNLTPNVLQTPSSAERLDILEYAANDEDHQRKLLQVKMTHPCISNTSTDIQTNVEQFLFQQLNLLNGELDDRMYFAKMPQPKTVLIRLCHHRFKLLLFQVKNTLCNNNNEAYSDLFINENLTSLNYSLLKKLKPEKNIRIEHNLANFEVVYNLQGKVFVKKARTNGTEGCVHTHTNFYLKIFLDQFNASHRPFSMYRRFQHMLSKLPSSYLKLHPPSKGPKQDRHLSLSDGEPNYLDG